MNDEPRPDEFALIEEVFAPLAAGFPGAFGLTDDAAVIAPTAGNELVTTIDSIVAGVHFQTDAPGAEVARRLLRVNLSDLAAMGARPIAYLLALNLPAAVSMSWLRDFAKGLAQDQAIFGVALIGGDTTATPGPLTATITALGEAPKDTLIKRSTARPGDLVYVSGTVGDAALGLLVLRGDLAGEDEAVAAPLAARYRLPEPRIALGQALRSLASACADVSDGLVADLGHICAASGVGAEIHADRLPLSAAARTIVERDAAFLRPVLSGGDDYELVFTVPADREADLATAAAAAGVQVARIGRAVPGAGVVVLDEAGTEIALDGAGFQHF